MSIESWFHRALEKIFGECTCMSPTTTQSPAVTHCSCAPLYIGNDCTDCDYQIDMRDQTHIDPLPILPKWPDFEEEITEYLQGDSEDAPVSQTEVSQLLDRLKSLVPVDEVVPFIETKGQLARYYFKQRNFYLYDPGLIRWIGVDPSINFLIIQAQLCLGFDYIHPNLQSMAELLRTCDPVRLTESLHRRFEPLSVMLNRASSCKRYKATLDADGFISLYALDFYACGADKQLYRMREASEFWINVAQKCLEHEIQRPNEPWPWLFAGNEFTLPKFIASCRALLPQR